MNTHLWWYLSRATGIVALVLLVLSFVWGVLLSTRALRSVDRPAWLLATHTWLSGTGLVMTAAHLAGLVLDGWVDFGALDLLVPGVASWQGASQTALIGTGIGVVTLYLMLIIHVTSFLRRWLSRRVWLALHRLSFPVVFMALIHAGWAGTDTSNRVYQVMAVMLAMTAAAATIVRVIIPSRTRARSAA